MRKDYIVFYIDEQGNVCEEVIEACLGSKYARRIFAKKRPDKIIAIKAKPALGYFPGLGVKAKLYRGYVVRFIDEGGKQQQKIVNASGIFEAKRMTPEAVRFTKVEKYRRPYRKTGKNRKFPEGGA